MPLAGNAKISEGFSNLLDFFYPTVCLICDQYIDSGSHLICSSCWDKATASSEIFCLNCRGLITEGIKCPNCDSKSAFPVLALGRFAGPLREIVHQFKYHGYHRLAELLAQGLINKYTSVLEKDPPFDALVPIPLDSFRKKKRGFNQAALLADILGERLKVPVERGFLSKAKKTKDQTRLDMVRRAENMKGAFRTANMEITGKMIILVDDVLTTGATMREAVAVLSAAGARPSLAIVAAVAD
ncbi:putative Competence protein F [Candidatus Zixiibacteriota bacterium]|nr:putative Competence protein F [candidate division Zixibacteria bacterium]